HAIKKPAILMVSAGQKLPFDIMTERTIFFNISEIESIENARAELARQVGFIESNQFDIGSPFSLTEDVIVRASTGNPLDKDIATIAGDLAYLKSALSNALAEIRPERQRPNRIRTMT